MEPVFLSIQGSYKFFQIALWRGTTCLVVASLESVRASAQGVLLLERLLHDGGMALADVSFIAVDQGPGAFTSLRVTLTVVNALSFARSIPLIGVDGLDALAEHVSFSLRSGALPVTILVLLNAYSNEVYAALFTCSPDGTVQEDTARLAKGSYHIDAICSLLSQFAPDERLFIGGNAASLYEEKLRKATGERVMIDTTGDYGIAGTQTLAAIALRRWNQGEQGVRKLLPLYLKQGMSTGAGSAS